MFKKTLMALPVAAALAFSASTASAQIGIFEASMDIDAGRLGAAGSATYNQTTGTYTVKGSGHDIWDDRDNFHFLYRKWNGDFDLSARVSIADGLATQDWIKSVIMARNDLSPGSPNICTRVRRDGQFSTQWRRIQDDTDSKNGTPAADRITTGINGLRQRFVRNGNMFSTYYQEDGSNTWNLVHIPYSFPELSDPFYLGFGVTAHDVGQIATGTFSQVSLTRPFQGSEVITFQEGVSPAGYAGTRDAHIISWDGVGNQLTRKANGANGGGGATANESYNEAPNNTGGHDFIEEGDYGGGTADSKVILISFDVTSIPTANARRIGRAQIGLYFNHERSAGGNGDGPVNPAVGDKFPHNVNVQAVLKPWDEGNGGAASNVDGDNAADNSGAVTWNSTGRVLWEAMGAEGPSDVGPVVSSTYFDPTVPGHWIWLDVTPLARQWVANPGSNNGVKISQETDNRPLPATVYVDGAYNFNSSEHATADLRPKLVVEMFGASNVGEEWSIYQ